MSTEGSLGNSCPRDIVRLDYDKIFQDMSTKEIDELSQAIRDIWSAEELFRNALARLQDAAGLDSDEFPPAFQDMMFARELFLKSCRRIREIVGHNYGEIFQNMSIEEIEEIMHALREKSSVKELFQKPHLTSGDTVRPNHEETLQNLFTVGMSVNLFGNPPTGVQHVSKPDHNQSIKNLSQKEVDEILGQSKHKVSPKELFQKSRMSMLVIVRSDYSQIFRDHIFKEIITEVSKTVMKGIKESFEKRIEEIKKEFEDTIVIMGENITRKLIETLSDLVDNDEDIYTVTNMFVLDELSGTYLTSASELLVEGQVVN